MTGNINSNSMGGGPILPPPTDQLPPTVTKTITGSTSHERDQIEQSQSKLDKAAADLEISFSLHWDAPSPPKPPDGARFGSVAGAGGHGGGGGNPFLAPNPMVRIQTAMLKLYETLRQSNLAQAQYENTTMSLNIAFAKTAASLIIAAGNSEAHMALLEAVAAGVGAAAAGLSMGVSGVAFGKAHYSGGAKLDAAKAKVAATEKEIGTPSNPKADPPIEASGKSAEVEAAQLKYKASQDKLADLKAKRAAAETEQPQAGVSPSNPRQEKIAQQKKINELNRNIEDQKIEVSRDKLHFETKRDELNVLKDRLTDERSVKNTKMQSQYQNFNNITQIAGMLNTFLSQGAQAVTKGMSMQDIMAKAEAQAQQQIVDALRENTKMSGQAVTQSMQGTKEIMNAIITDSKQIDDMTTHVSLSRT